jgi:hypothetical protein
VFSVTITHWFAVDPSPPWGAAKEGISSSLLLGIPPNVHAFPQLLETLLLFALVSLEKRHCSTSLWGVHNISVRS